MDERERKAVRIGMGDGARVLSSCWPGRRSLEWLLLAAGSELHERGDIWLFGASVLLEWVLRRLATLPSARLPAMLAPADEREH